MVPRHGFVQRERFHFPLRPRVQVVGIHEITAGPARTGGALLVVRGSLRRRFEFRNHANTVREPRQFSEEMRELGIDFLGHDTVAVY